MTDARNAAARPDVTVVGSLHMDVVAEVDVLPRPGETVLGHRHFRNPGGKGANQAVAAARLGSRVAMVGRVGDDEDGRLLRDKLADEGIDTATVGTGELLTGTAFITVDDAGENVIVVSAGASGALSPGDVEEAGAAITGAQVVLLQLEVPMETVTAAAAAATGTVILNPAPAASVSEELLGHLDLLVPNQGELAQLVGAEPATDHDDVAEQARRLTGHCPVVVTLGSDGLLLCRDDDVVHIAADEVEVVDTTAAGDACCGALADGLVRGLDLEDACRRAVRAAGIAVTRSGAQQSLPTADEVDAAS